MYKPPYYEIRKLYSKDRGLLKKKFFPVKTFQFF